MKITGIETFVVSNGFTPPRRGTSARSAPMLG